MSDRELTAYPSPRSIAQLEGLALPWTVLEQVLLPQRVADFRGDLLDVLSARGEVVWVGHAPLGQGDGRIAVYRRENAGKLLAPRRTITKKPTEIHAAIVDHLESRGASFLSELEDAVRRSCPGTTTDEFSACLWDLVWAGVITNDTFQPLRSLTRPRRRGSRSLAGGRWSLVRDPGRSRS